MQGRENTSLIFGLAKIENIDDSVLGTIIKIASQPIRGCFFLQLISLVCDLNEEVIGLKWIAIP